MTAGEGPGPRLLVLKVEEGPEPRILRNLQKLKKART